MSTRTIPGYTYGQAAPSPVTAEELALLEQTVLLSEEDTKWLATAADVLEPQVDAILDLWYGFVGDHPHLLAYFSDLEGNPIGEYLQRVRARFGQWILDSCRRPRDAAWLAYQEEIARRHHREGKNRTDQVESVPLIPLRYLIAFIYPIAATIRDFLATDGRDPAEVDAMYHAWFKVVTLQVALWARPYGGQDW